jgi:hypothetical protein
MAGPSRSGPPVNPARVPPPPVPPARPDGYHLGSWRRGDRSPRDVDGQRRARKHPHTPHEAATLAVQVREGGPDALVGRLARELNVSHRT